MSHFTAIREKIIGADLDAVLLCSEANRFYASGFHTSAEEDAIVVVTRKNAYFITDSRYTEAVAAQVKDAVLLPRANAAPYIDYIKKAVVDDGVGKLGFEDDAMNVRDYNEYSSALACEFVPASGLFVELRQTKDDEEIGNMIKAQRIAEKAFTQLLSEIKPGMTEKELAARLQYLMMVCGADKHSFDTIVASGANGSMPHAVPTDKPVQEGEFITFDFGALYHGYCSDMTRTVALGHVTDEMAKVYAIVLEAQLKGISLAKAGVIGRDVHNAAAEVISAAGYGEYFGHGFGHSLGIQIHESPNFNSRNDKPMPVGAVVSAEPGIYIPGKFGVRIEDVVVLKEDGCEDITLMPKELTIIPV